jgi:CBS domain-containing protein
MKQELVRDWMTSEVVTIKQETSLAEAHELMKNRRIRRLPVMDHESIVGILTLGDVRAAEPSGASTLSVWEANNLLANLKVAEIMTRNPATISEDAPVSEAQARMRTLKLKALIALDAEGRVSGVIEVFDDGHGVRG